MYGDGLYGDELYADGLYGTDFHAPSYGPGSPCECGPGMDGMGMGWTSAMPCECGAMDGFTGPFVEGDWNQGGWVEGGWTDGGWVEGDWVEGEWIEGEPMGEEWAEDSFSPSPSDSSIPPGGGGEPREMPAEDGAVPDPMPVSGDQYFTPPQMLSRRSFESDGTSVESSTGGSPIQPVLWVPSGL